MSLMEEHKGFVIGWVVVGVILIIGSYAASASGFGAQKPIPEQQRASSVRHGGFIYIFGYGGGARGVGGRGTMGGGPGMGK